MLEFTPETFAIAVHSGQKYGEHLYSYHLQRVVANTVMYSKESHEEAAAWLHDVIEDTGVTYFDLTRRFGSPTANIVWACTGVGNNRKERVASILAKLPIYPGAPLVKTADRIANMEAGLEENNTSKLSMYLKEHSEFARVVGPYIPADMLTHLTSTKDKAIIATKPKLIVD